MNERSLAFFSAAVRTGSFSLAASELNVTQQSVSYSIGKLEDELGFLLFVRGGQKLNLTYWGSRFSAWYNDLESSLWFSFTQKYGQIYTGLLSDLQVLCFLALAEHKRLGSASERLHYAPATVLSYVEQMEKTLGTELMTHRNGNYALTDAGQLYEKIFRAAADSLQALKQEQRQRQERGKKQAIVGVSPWIDPEKLFSEVKKKLGNDRLEIHILPHEQLLNDLLSGQLDVVFWSEGQAPSDSSLEHTRAAREQLGLMSPAGRENCPVAFCPAWPRSVSEDRVIFVQELPLLHFQPEGMRIAENFQSLSELLRLGLYAAVTDIRFGSLSDYEGMKYQPLKTESYVLASHLSGEIGECAACLIKTMQAVLCEDTKE